MEYSTRNNFKLTESDDHGSITANRDNWEDIDDLVAKCDFNASTDPTSDTDNTLGWAAGSRITNQVDGRGWECQSAATGAAIWRKVWDSEAEGGVADQVHAADNKTTPANDDELGLVDSAALYVLKKLAWSDLKAALKTYFDTLYAVTAKGVTNGDSHDHSGGDGAAIPTTATSFSATSKVLGRKTAGAGAGEELSLSDVLDLVGAAAQGDILVRGASAWSRLGVSTGGKVLTEHGASADLTWETPSGGAVFWTQETHFTATPASTSTLTMTADQTGTIKAGCGLKYAIGGTTYYGLVTAITSNLLTVAGAPLSGDVTALYWCDPTRVLQVDFFVPGAFADAANTGLLASDARTKFRWGLRAAYCVQILHTVRVDDSGANQPHVTISIAGSAVGTDNTNAGQAVAETWTPTVVGINTSNYDIQTGEAIEVVTDAEGSNDDATDLTVSALFVIP